MCKKNAHCFAYIEFKVQYSTFYNILVTLKLEKIVKLKDLTYSWFDN